MRSLPICLTLLGASLLPMTGETTRRPDWADEFDGPTGSRPDPRRWTYDTGAGGLGNNELQSYSDSSSNVALVGKGYLAIRALKPRNDAFTSGRIKTRGKYKLRYGRVAARMRLPTGQGIWPAFWALGENYSFATWPASGEIDFMESIGSEPFSVHGTLHGPGYSGTQAIGFHYSFSGGIKPSDGFHVYSADWTSERISFAVDGVTYGAVIRQNLPPGSPWVFDHPFFLILHVAVGGNWPGPPNSSTVFPQEL